MNQQNVAANRLRLAANRQRLASNCRQLACTGAYTFLKKKEKTIVGVLRERPAPDSTQQRCSSTDPVGGPPPQGTAIPDFVPSCSRAESCAGCDTSGACAGSSRNHTPGMAATRTLKGHLENEGCKAKIIPFPEVYADGKRETGGNQGRGACSQPYTHTIARQTGTTRFPSVRILVSWNVKQGRACSPPIGAFLQ